MTKFTVNKCRMRLTIAILADVNEVHNSFIKNVHNPKLLAGTTVHGYYGNKTIVLPANGADLFDIVPHEVTHAIIERYGVVDAHYDEPVATAIGIFTSAILRKLMKMGCI